MAPVMIPIVPPVVIISGSRRRNKTGNTERHCKHLEKQTFHEVYYRGSVEVATRTSFPSSRCVSTTKTVRPVESMADAQLQLHPALLRQSNLLNFRYYR